MAAILLYHSLAPEVIDPQLQVTVETLVSHLECCRDLGYQAAPLEDALTYSAEPLFAVTFDDGFASLYLGWPELKKRRIRPTVFVCPGAVGHTNQWASPGRARERLLDVAEIRQCRAEGISVGCHGWDHRPFVGRTADDMSQDLARCDNWFRTNLGHKPPVFAWPFGRFDADALRVVGLSYRYALAIEPTWNEDVRPLALPRIVGTSAMTAEELAAELALKSFVFDPDERRS